jgi:hypothetical protein
MNKLTLRTKTTFFLCLLMVVAVTWMVTAVAPVGRADSENLRRQSRIFAVTHGPTTTVLADSSSNGHQLGDLRVVSLPTSDEHGREVGRLDATLITTGIDEPNPNDEIRISNLIFVFGDGVDQIVVNGSGFYPGAGSTIELNTTLVRPLTGGSGAFAGATGWAETEHFADDTWQHTFHLLNAGGRDGRDDEDNRGRRHRHGRSERH